MRPDPRAYLHDVQKAIDLLSEFTAEKTFADYASDSLLRAGVEREFGIIGEALARLA